VLASYFDRLKISAMYAFGAMVNGWFISTASLISGQIYAHNGIPAYWYGIEPMYPGLFFALFWWGLGKLEKPKIDQQHVIINNKGLRTNTLIK
jgi:hypothetical protein